ncbi:MAG: hypothetical protein ACKV2Q_18515 [Planctomycetaceae bacterium]
MNDSLCLPNSVKKLGTSKFRLIVSFALAVLSAASVALMVRLVETHVPEDDFMAGARDPGNKVFLCMAAATCFAMMSSVIAVPAFLVRKFSPLLWLIPLFIGEIWFVNWYDWYGLFYYGKAWVRPPAVIKPIE